MCPMSYGNGSQTKSRSRLRRESASTSEASWSVLGRPGFCQGDRPEDPINIKTTAALGEPKRIAVVSVDGTVAAFAEAVPFPIEASDENCKLSVVRIDTLAETVVARATGFVADESLTVTTQSNDEGATTKNAAGPQGNWTSVIVGAPKD